ncbi:PDR/VanB family oxidoreductase [Leifsonia sp. Root4]|uniref:PDR/VanB family oxidoreductase n=1 Tax=Leifsonia sp. Root4 TaxID=1736525 RepID=UPI000B05B7BC|nr:PDR/VanB family oxidoreductase [Leifsonia sp. Root4]
MSIPLPTTAPGAQRLTLRVAELRFEARDVVSVLLCDPTGIALDEWSPGAHIDVRFGNGVERQYSLCSDPADRSGWRFAVLREPVSRGGSSYVHDSLRPGELLDVSLPRNNFELADAGNYVFVAGGIGITPLLPMIRSVAARGAAWRLAYLGGSAERMAFTGSAEVADGNSTLIAGDRDGRLDLAGWIGAVGADTRVYACGPERLLEALESLSTGWPTGVLRLERFQAKALSEPLSTEAFEVEARRSGVTVRVENGCSVLDMLERAGIGVPSSCLEGVCGTCETDVIDGDVDHRDSILSPDEREANETMMICVSRATSSTLVLDI